MIEALYIQAVKYTLGQILRKKRKGAPVYVNKMGAVMSYVQAEQMLSLELSSLEASFISLLK